LNIKITRLYLADQPKNARTMDMTSLKKFGKPSEGKKLPVEPGHGSLSVCHETGEVIERDRYFFKAAVACGASLQGDMYPGLEDEAFELLGSQHKEAYHRAPDDAGRMRVIRHYFENIQLPARRSKSPEEIGTLMMSGKQWVRYERA
jgi:hypothetical protein